MLCHRKPAFSKALPLWSQGLGAAPTPCFYSEADGPRESGASPPLPTSPKKQPGGLGPEAQPQRSPLLCWLLPSPSFLECLFKKESLGPTRWPAVPLSQEAGAWDGAEDPQLGLPGAGRAQEVAVFPELTAFRIPRNVGEPYNEPAQAVFPGPRAPTPPSHGATVPSLR